MPWLRLDDDFFLHPKVIAAGDSGVALYVRGLSYCGRYLTDGFIAAGQVKYLVESETSTVIAEHLVKVGLWEKTEGGYQVHDYLKYNPSAEKVKADRAVNAARQAAWRDARRGDDGSFLPGDEDGDEWPGDEGGAENGGYDSESNGVSNGKRNSVTIGVSSTRPVPTPVPVPNPEPSALPGNPVAPIGASEIPRKERGRSKAREPAYPPGCKPYDLFLASCWQLGVDAKRVTKTTRGAELKYAKEILESGWSIEDAKACIRYMQTNDFWRDKRIGLASVAKELPTWDKIGRPATKGGKPTVARKPVAPAIPEVRHDILGNELGKPRDKQTVSTEEVLRAIGRPAAAA